MKKRENESNMAEKSELEFIVDFIRKNITTKPIKVKRQISFFDTKTKEYKSITTYEYILINIFNVKKFHIKEDPTRNKIVLIIYFSFGHSIIEFDKNNVLNLEGEIISEV
jgi:hypothetical protein